jgi:hypothetical protein
MRRGIDKFMAIYAIIAVDGQICCKRGNVSGLTSIREVPKTVFLTAVAKVSRIIFMGEIK